MQNARIQKYTHCKTTQIQKQKSGGQNLERVPFVAPSVPCCKKKMQNDKKSPLHNYRNTKEQIWWINLPNYKNTKVVALFWVASLQ